ncbi:MAG: hypothetical protein DRH11_18590, partial [Deltaproteobacteria bacterium]
NTATSMDSGKHSHQKGGFIMPDWKCQNCGYTLQGEIPPEQYPSCKEKCEFADVSCYIPECGETGRDNRLG